MTLDAAYPVALLPVRLETSFAGSLLQVRIFPDDIWADTHEPELTARRAAPTATPTSPRRRRARPPSRRPGAMLVARWTAPRAAYIASAAAGGSPATRAESWTRAAAGAAARPLGRARLPGADGSTRSPSSAVRTAARADPVARLDPGRPGAALRRALDRRRRCSGRSTSPRRRAAGMAVTIDLTTPGPAHVGRGPAPAAGVDLLVVVGVSESQAAGRRRGAAARAARCPALHARPAFLPPGTPTNNTPGGAGRVPAARPGRRRQLRRRARSAAGRRRPARPAPTARPSRAPSACRSRRRQVAAVEHVDGGRHRRRHGRPRR